jgi:hypothetical protein
VPNFDLNSAPHGNQRGFVVTIVGEKHWTKAQIAALSFSQVARLSYEEMVTIVLDAGVPMRDAEYVHTMEGDTLMRHVYWARECCRRETVEHGPT